MTAALAPTAPPSYPIAPTAAAPATSKTATVLDLAALSDAVASSADPVAVLTQLVLATAARSRSAAEQGRTLSNVNAAISKTLDAVRTALLDSVGGTAGVYAGFTVTATAGGRQMDYKRLEAEYPDIYDELVTTKSPGRTLKYTA
ncbi:MULTISPECIES: hypothetical protein [Mycobacteriaceae]|uniref:Uncharacterized protein n=2 Tax=Mycolicibacterium TaxID=1866885 RepID=A0ABS4ZR96_9MYCO|nr:MULTISPECIES: hypothetical protein [Mycobacteriaceae]MBP2451998.1 hypothetical protein [Mycolicibacterium lutetiense]